MQIKIDQELINGDFHISFLEIPSTEVENAEFILATKKYGIPSVDFGGAFTNGTDLDVLYTFNSNVKEIPNNLPYTRIFKNSQYGVNAKPYAEAYSKELSKRINAVLDTLRDNTDDFSNMDTDILY